MTTKDTIEQLRAQADALEVLAELEERAAEAKAAYRTERTDERKAEHRAASQALAEQRETLRANDAPRLVEPGGVTITPQPVKGA